MTITYFQGIHHFLCNFHYAPFNYDGLRWDTSENAFQAAKTDDQKTRKLMTKMSPSEAKKLGNKVKLIDGWDQKKYKIMEDILIAKFAQNPDIKEKLIKTYPQQLIEGNTWHDNIWGDCTCQRCSKIQGNNWLGKILMNIRFGFIPKTIKIDPRYESDLSKVKASIWKV